MSKRTRAVIIASGVAITALVAGLRFWTSHALTLQPDALESVESVRAAPVPGFESRSRDPAAVESQPAPAPLGDAGSDVRSVSRRYLEGDEFKHLVKLGDEQRNCEASKLCPSGMACWYTPDRKIGCYASNCRGIADVSTCGPGDACTATTLGVFRCAPAGFLKAGAECLDLQSASAERRCGAALLCLGGRCSEGCLADDDCGGGKCLATGHGSFCARARGLCKESAECLEGQRCVESSDGVGVCAAPARLPSGHSGCVPGGCAASEVCSGQLWGKQFFGTCLPLCSNGSCAPGSACAPSDTVSMTGILACYRTCEPGDGVCEPDGDCSYNPEKSLGLCVPHQPHDRTVNAGIEHEQMMTSAPDAWPGSPRR